MAIGWLAVHSSNMRLTLIGLGWCYDWRSDSASVTQAVTTHQSPVAWLPPERGKVACPPCLVWYLGLALPSFSVVSWPQSTLLCQVKSTLADPDFDYNQARTMSTVDVITTAATVAEKQYQLLGRMAIKKMPSYSSHGHHSRCFVRADQTDH